MTLNSTVRIPPRTRKVSPLRTGRYATKIRHKTDHCILYGAHTFDDIRLEVDIKDVAAQPPDRVVERKDVDALSILDIQTRMHVDHVSELHAKVVAGNLIHLDLALLNVVGAQANEDSIMPLLPTEVKSDICTFQS